MRWRVFSRNTWFLSSNFSRTFLNFSENDLSVLSAAGLVCDFRGDDEAPLGDRQRDSLLFVEKLPFLFLVLISLSSFRRRMA